MDKDQQDTINRLESEARARSFQRARLVTELVQSGTPEPIAIQKALSTYPTSNARVVSELNDFATKIAHPKEFVPLTMGGETYNSNTITGQVGNPYKVNAPTQSWVPITANGRTGQSNEITGRVIYDPAISPNGQLDSSGRALGAKVIEAANSDEFGKMTNSPANVLNQYQNLVNPQRSPVAPTQPTETIEFVIMTNPRGQSVKVPSNRVEELKSKGYR